MFGEDEKTSTISAVIPTMEHAQRSAYLIVVSGRSSIGKMFRLGGEMTIGRSGVADILIEDDGVSRRHAKITVRRDGVVELEDMGSTNGTFHNGEKIARQVLQDGDKIQVGSATILKFSYQDELDEAWQKNLYESATRDGLTRIYNRKYFNDAVAKEFAYAQRHEFPLSLVMFDIDHFKEVNDTHGHAAGDQVLQHLAHAVTQVVRSEDLFCRYGGEEFAVLLREAPAGQALVVAERVRQTVQALDLHVGPVHIPVAVSVGVATLVGRNYARVEDFIDAADKFLYRAKENGRNRVEPHPPTGGQNP
jgi:two-component system, cell cycle response regulator